MQTFFKPFLPLLFLAAFTYAQNCYYPNGELAQGDGPCYTTDGTCCPYQWQCLSNGLCYLDNENYYGRYTCTDQSWQSSSCPNYCTNGGTAPGNEALLLCADGSWCCDGDRSFNCCTTAGTDHFRLPQGSPISLILDVPSAMPEASSGKVEGTGGDGKVLADNNLSFQSTADVYISPGKHFLVLSKYACSCLHHHQQRRRH